VKHDLSAYIQKYIHHKIADKLDCIIRQVDGISALCSHVSDADFVGLLFKKEPNGILFPVSFYDRTGLSAEALSLLEKQWTDCDYIAKLIETNSESGLYEYDCSDSVDDEFAAKNNFSHASLYLHYQGDNLCCVIIAYRCQSPEPFDESIEIFFRHIAEMLIVIMSLVTQLQNTSSYIRRLSNFISMFDCVQKDLKFDEVISELIKQPVSIPSVDGVVLLTKKSESGGFCLGEVVEEQLSSEFIKELVKRINSIDNHKNLEKGNDEWQDLSDYFNDYYTGVVAVEISSESDSQMMMIALAIKPDGFSVNDMELLALFSYCARTIIKNTLVVQKFKETNKLLKSSSARMANFESLAALADMTSGVAHDFNNIFGGVIGRLQLIKMRVEDEKLFGDLEKIEKLLLEGAQTVKHIQEFVTSTRYKTLEAVDLGKVVSDTLAMKESKWQKLSETKNISVKSLILVEPAVIDGFEPDLVKLLEKLLENAVEHSPESSKVEVILRADSKGYCLSVVDEGPGIPKNIKEKIFYPFFTTKHVHGAGLSLATVHGIVVRHGARIKVARYPKKGAVFNIYFKLPDKIDEISDISRKEKSKARIKVLVVDDDEQIREVLSDMLKIDGHEPKSCVDGYSALDELGKEEYDLMITDLGMPGMSGLDLAVYAHDNYPDMPIAMITGWGTQLNEDEVKMKGIRIVLSKPFHLEEVKALVEELVH